MTAQEHAERIARAVESGPSLGTWTQDSFDPRCVRGADGYSIAWCGSFPESYAHMNSAYIAAANPAALTALLSERAEMAARVRELEGALKSVAALDPEKDSAEGYNEWGEAVCFHKAQEVARAALKGQP